VQQSVAGHHGEEENLRVAQPKVVLRYHHNSDLRLRAGHQFCDPTVHLPATQCALREGQSQMAPQFLLPAEGNEPERGFCRDGQVSGDRSFAGICRHEG